MLPIIRKRFECFCQKDTPTLTQMKSQGAASASTPNSAAIKRSTHMPILEGFGYNGNLEQSASLQSTQTHMPVNAMSSERQTAPSSTPEVRTTQCGKAYSTATLTDHCDWTTIAD